MQALNKSGEGIGELLGEFWVGDHYVGEPPKAPKAPRGYAGLIANFRSNVPWRGMFRAVPIRVLRVNMLQLQAIDQIAQTFSARFFVQVS